MAKAKLKLMLEILTEACKPGKGVTKIKESKQITGDFKKKINKCICTKTNLESP